MQALISMMRAIHFIFGITTPDKEHEKMIVFVWIGIIVGVVSLGVLFAWFIIPFVMR